MQERRTRKKRKIRREIAFCFTFIYIKVHASKLKRPTAKSGQLHKILGTQYDDHLKRSRDKTNGM